MRQVLAVACILSCWPAAAAADFHAIPVADGVRGLRCLTVGSDGQVYATSGGTVVKLADGKAVPFVSGLRAPVGLGAFQNWLYVTETGPTRAVRKIDAKGKLVDFATIPGDGLALRGLVVDPENGTVYVTDHQQIYRIDPKGKVSVVTDSQKALGSVEHLGALALDGASFLLVVSGAGELFRVNIATGTGTKMLDGLNRGSQLAWDPFGRLYLTVPPVAGGAPGKVLVIPRPGERPVELAKDLMEPWALCVEADGKRLLVGTDRGVFALPTNVPGAEVDEAPLALEPEVAFPDLTWTGWADESETGLPSPLRPIVLTHAGDGSNRVFVALQQGSIHVFPNDPKARATKVFLDLTDKVRYDDKTNEEGFLGLAFHPRYKENGEFFVFYTDRKLKSPDAKPAPAKEKQEKKTNSLEAKTTNVLARFRVRKDDPDRADPASEEILLRIERPFWNHDGGTLAFGPDGHLYVALGDGGAANDPFDNAQNLGTILGSVLRLDVDRKDNGKPYAIPKDNPFVGQQGACPEIWAYGLRNPWRMAFDRKTGKLWAADVGQNLYEEIDILRAGGNYGWRRREGLHPFAADGSGPSPKYIDPIWEYRHDVGRSITGGTVYRGPRLAELQGAYLYADYISCKLWALWYDEAKGRVAANRPIRDRNQAILSFGEDEQGEVYYLTYSTTGQGIYRFARAATATTAPTPPAAREVPITEALLKSLPRRKVETKEKDGKSVTYEGVTLDELLRNAGVPLGKDLKGPALGHVVLVEAADGYRVVFSLAECDPATGDRVVLLADRRDGKELNPQEGPTRLVVPGDLRRARWVRRISRITVQPAAAK